MAFFDLSKLIERMAVNKDITGFRFSVGKQPLVEVNNILAPVEVKGLSVVTAYQTEIISRSLMNGDLFMAEELAKMRRVFGYFNTPNYHTQFCIKLLRNGNYFVAMRLLPSSNLTSKSIAATQSSNLPGAGEDFFQADFDWTNMHLILCLSQPSPEQTVEKVCDPSKVKAAVEHIAWQAIDSLTSKYAVDNLSWITRCIEPVEDSAKESTGELHNDVGKKIVLLDPDFDGSVPILRYINSLSPKTRRNVHLVLVSPKVKTQDTYMAFLNCVNLTLNPEDLDSFPLVLQNSVNDYEQLY